MYAVHPLCRIIKGLRITKWAASCHGMLNHTMRVLVQLEESKSKKPSCLVSLTLKKVKVILQQAKVAQGVLGRLRPRIFVTFGTTRVVSRQPYALAAFTLGEIPGTHFQGLSRPQGTWFCWGEPQKKSPVTPPGIDPRTIQLVAQCLNHHATPGPLTLKFKFKFRAKCVLDTCRVLLLSLFCL